MPGFRSSQAPAFAGEGRRKKARRSPHPCPSPLIARSNIVHSTQRPAAIKLMTRELITVTRTVQLIPAFTVFYSLPPRSRRVGNVIFEAGR
jgi:hypothetical protein